MTVLPTPAPAQFPAPTPFPAPTGLQSPYFGLNPYQGTNTLLSGVPGVPNDQPRTLYGLPAPSLPDSTLASLLSAGTGTSVTGYPGLATDLSSTIPNPQADQQAALSQVQTGIAKLATVNPELAQQLQGQFANPGSTGGGGGFLGSIMHLGGDILGGVGKVFDIIGRTAHLVPAFVAEATGHGQEGNPLATLGAVMTGQDQTNWNKVFQEEGWTGGGVFGVVRAALGFGLDIATDPLTYLFSPGAAVGTGEKAAQTAELVGTRALAERAAAAGIGETTQGAYEALTKISRAAWEGVEPGVAHTADAVGQAEHTLGSMLGTTITAEHQAILGDLVTVQGQVYDAVANRTFKSSLLRDGMDFLHADGTPGHIAGSEVKDILNQAVRAGAGQDVRAGADAAQTWQYAKNASAAMGGFRVKALVPFTQLRWISPALPFTDRLSFGALGRFASGAMGAKQLTGLIHAGAEGADYSVMRDFMEMSWKDFTKSHDAIAQQMAAGRFGGIKSSFYSLSDEVGNLTAAVTPGAKQFRLGIGGYYAETALKAQRSKNATFIHDVMGSVYGVDGKTGKKNLAQLLEDGLGLSFRKKYNVATTEDLNHISTWLDMVGQGAPLSGTEAELRTWFDQMKGAAYHMGRANPEIPEEVARDAARQDAAWKDLLAAHQWANANPKRLQALTAVHETERHGRQFLLGKGVNIGSATSDFESATHVLPSDLPETGGKVMYYTPADAGDAARVDEQGFGTQAVRSNDLHQHGHVSGVALHETDQGGDVRVWVPDGHTLELNPDLPAAANLPAVLDDQGRYNAAQQSAREAADTLAAPLREANPEMAIPGANDQLVGNLMAADLRGQGDGYRFVHTADGTLVALNPRDLKVVTEGAAAAETGRGFFHRGFSEQLSKMLKGTRQSGKVIISDDQVLALQKDLQRTMRHRTLAEAERETRSILRARYQAAGASEDVLKKLDTIPIFERNALKAHEQYTRSLVTAYTASTEGKIQARMLAVSRLSPLMFGRMADADAAHYTLDAEVVKLFKKATKAQQVTMLNFMAKDRQLADALVKRTTDGGTQVQGLVTAVEDGLNPDVVSPSKLLQRFVDSSQHVDELVAKERATHTERLAKLAEEADTHAKAVNALAGIGLEAPQARALQEAELQAQLAPLQAEAKAVMKRASALPAGKERDFLTARLRQLSAQKDRIVAEHDARILTETPETYAAAPDTAARINELDGIIDSKTTSLSEPANAGAADVGKEGMTERGVARDDASLARAKANGHAEQLGPDIWVIRPGPSHTAVAEGNMVQQDLYLKLGADGHVVSRRVVTRDGEVVAEGVRGLPHIEDISPGEALGRAHWADKGIDTLDKAQAEISKQKFSEEGAALNKKLVRFVADQPPTTPAIADAARPTADQVREALDNGQLRVLVKDGKVSILTKDGALRQGGRRLRPLDAILSDLDRSRAALAELDQIQADGGKALEDMRVTHAARAQRTLDGTLNRLSSEANRVGTKVAKQQYAQGRRVGKAAQRIQDAYREMNKAVTELQGVSARLQPAITFSTDAVDHSVMVPLRVPGLEGGWAHAYVAEEMHNMLEGKDIGTLQRAWREHVLGPWKRWATYRNPGFHVRIAFGTWFNNFLGGVNSADYAFSHRVAAAADGKGAEKLVGEAEFRRLGLHLTPGFDGLENKLTYGHLAGLMSDQGIGAASGVAVAFADEAGGQLVDTGRGKLSKFLNTYDRLGRKAASTSQDFFRGAAWSAGMRNTHGDLAGARAFTMSRHGDYADLTSSEQNIRDIIPFYKFMRTNVPLQIRMLADNPFKMTLLLKAQRSIADAEGLDWNAYQASKPAWLRNTFSIPLPGNRSLFEDLPYSELHMGFHDFLARALPVGTNIIESYGFNKDLFTGGDLTGKMVPLSGPLGWAMNLPGIREMAAALPFVQKGANGQLYVQDKFENVLQVFPLYSRFRYWAVGDPTASSSRLNALTGWLTSVKVVPPDLTAQEKSFYYDNIAPAIAAYQSMGYVLPTKDQLAAASAAVQTPAPFDFASAYPSGQVA